MKPILFWGESSSARQMQAAENLCFCFCFVEFLRYWARSVITDRYCGGRGVCLKLPFSMIWQKSTHPLGHGDPNMAPLMTWQPRIDRHQDKPKYTDFPMWVIRWWINKPICLCFSFLGGDDNVSDSHTFSKNKWDVKWDHWNSKEFSRKLRITVLLLPLSYLLVKCLSNVSYKQDVMQAPCGMWDFWSNSDIKPT